MKNINQRMIKTERAEFMARGLDDIRQQIFFIGHGNTVIDLSYFVCQALMESTWIVFE